MKHRIQDDMKTAMKAGDKRRLGIIRLILAAIKQREVDDRTELTDDQILAVLDKMVKQRRESLSHYRNAGRDDLANQEEFEIQVIQDYLPEALEPAEITRLITAAIADTGAESMRDMGKVMGLLKPKLQGRADMTAVSAQIKRQLSS